MPVGEQIPAAMMCDSNNNGGNADRPQVVVPGLLTEQQSQGNLAEIGAKRFKLVYFNVKGRAENSRMLLVLAGQPFEDVRLNAEEWLAFKSGTPFGQLPVLEVDGGQAVLCQSRAIERYLARELGFFGETSLESAKIDMILECINDAMDGICKAMQEQDSDKKAEILDDYKKNSKSNGLKNFTSFLRKHLQGPWFMGSKITLADVCVYNAFHYILTFVPDGLDECEVLREWTSRFEEHPQIADWLQRRPPSKY